jgi:hypothetical protein
MKNTTVFKNLIKKDSYQVFLFSSPAHIPLSVFIHPWFVINKKGVISRFEVRYKYNRNQPNLGHIHVNNLPPFSGIEVFSFLNHPYWNASLIGTLEGGGGSPAHKMCEFIEKSQFTYKDKNKYFLFGPNSNTYVQWILDNSPEFTAKLPWNALGNNYKKK